MLNHFLDIQLLTKFTHSQLSQNENKSENSAKELQCYLRSKSSVFRAMRS